jgi:hypothetical protein
MGIAPSTPIASDADLIASTLLGEAYANVKAVADNLETIQGLATIFEGDAGFTVIKHKRAEAGTYARTAAQLAAVGALDGPGISMMHWIDPELDELLLAGTNVTELHVELQAALDALNPGSKLTLPALRFLTGLPLKARKNGLVLDWTGAIIEANLDGAPDYFNPASFTGLTPVLALENDNIHLIGGELIESSEAANPWRLDISGNDITVEGTILRKVANPGGGSNYQAFLREVCGAKLLGISTFGSDGIGVFSSKRVLFDHCLFEAEEIGGDDAIAIKATTTNSEHITISNCIARRFAALGSIGSEIGTPGANDPLKSRRVRSVHVTNNQLEDCAGIVLCKPCGVGSIDYRDGVVEGLTISNNTLVDMDGSHFQRAIAITPGRGAIVRHVTGRNNKVIARASATAAGRLVGGVDIRLLDERATEPDSTAPGVHDIDVGVRFIDPYAGAAGVVDGGVAPGRPVTHIFAIQQVTAGWGTASKIVVNIVGEGSKESGFFVGSDLDDAVRIERLELTDVNVGNTAGGMHLLSRVDGRGAIIDVVPAAGPEMLLALTGELLEDIPVTAGDRGHILVSDDRLVWELKDGVVSLAKQANMATASVVYRKSGGAGPPEVQSLATLRTDLDIPADVDDLSDGPLVYRMGDLIPLGDGGTGAELIAPAADRLMFYDYSAGTVTWLELGAGLSIVGTQINAVGASLADGDYGDIVVVGGVIAVQAASGFFETAGYVQHNDSVRFSGTLTTATAGAGLEITYNGGNSRLTSVERGPGGAVVQYLPLWFRGSEIDLRPGGTSVGKFDATGLVMTSPVFLPASAYGVGWSGSLKAATEDAVYDVIESVVDSIDEIFTQDIVSAAVVTPTFVDDAVDITAQAEAIQFANWGGTPVDFWGLVIRLKDNGVTRAITYDTKYLASTGVTLPAATTVGKTHELAFQYNAALDKFICMSAVSY